MIIKYLLPLKRPINTPSHKVINVKEVYNRHESNIWRNETGELEIFRWNTEVLYS